MHLTANLNWVTFGYGITPDSLPFVDFYFYFFI